jgi:hypothetical protein
MAEKQLDLFQLAARGPTKFGASATSVMRRNPRNAGSFCVPTKELPDDFLAQALAANSVTAIHGPEYEAVRKPGCRGPGIDRHFGPRRHRNCAHAAVLADQIDNAPSVVPLLDVPERKRRNLRSAQSAAEQDTPGARSLLKTSLLRWGGITSGESTDYG